MSLNRLRGELKAIGVTQTEVADFLGMTTSNFNRKLAEAVPFTREEMFAIRDKFFPGVSLDHLFQSDGDVPSERDRLHAQADTLREVIDVSDEDMEKMRRSPVRVRSLAPERYKVRGHFPLTFILINLRTFVQKNR